MFIDDLEVFLIVASIVLCAILIGIELMHIVMFISYKSEYEKYNEEFKNEDDDQ